jgi:hypothetical protein
MPELDLSAPRPRSYDVSPARPPRPEVVVKRAHPVRPDVPTATSAPEAATETTPPVRPTRVFHVLAGVSVRRVRGLSLVLSVLLALVVSPLAALSLLPWWSVLIAVATLMVDITVLRHAAVSERAACRAEARARRSARSDRSVVRSGARDARDARDAGDTDYFAPGSSVEFEIESEYGAETAYDVQARVAGEGGTTRPTDSPVMADPSGWAPVPVPPPTYTLKAKAADPVPVPIPVPAPVLARATELADSECWSLDGLVYDCDLDELVERRSATGA